MHTDVTGVSVQTLDGSINVHLASDEVIEVRSGHALALALALAHDFEALEDSTLLLTMAWTGHRCDHPPHGAVGDSGPAVR